MTQKVLKVGSSAAVTLPKSLMEKVGIKIGDKVEIEMGRNNRLQISPVSSTKSGDAEVMAWTKSFIDRYGPALRALSKK